MLFFAHLIHICANEVSRDLQHEADTQNLWDTGVNNDATSLPPSG